MSLPDPATGPADHAAADEFKALVSTRESFYSSMGDRLAELPTPRVNKAYALYSREIVHVPLGATAGSAVMFSTMETLGAWAVVPAVATGLGIVFTGLWARFNILAPRTQSSIRADVAQAHDDFHTALSALTSPGTPVDVIMAVRWFEPRLAEAMRTLFDADASPDAGIRATETVLTIGSRAWALSQVEQRRAQLVESFVATAVESVPDTQSAEASRLDFAEIEAVAANISAETVAMATILDVDRPVD